VIAVLVPVLDRPHRVGPLVESIDQASRFVTRVVFLVTDGDDAQLAACLDTDAMTVVVPFGLDGGDYARKINYGVTVTDEPWLFQAADDLRFHHGWDTTALDAGLPHIGVVGTNDLGNPLTKAGRHATHSLIRRTYVEEHGTIDEPGKALHEGYHHCWVDNELVETAVHRRGWASARRSCVEHMHPIWPVDRRSRERKGQDDATYRRGQARYRDDHRLFMSRRPLWGRSPGRRSGA
jgi:hypothetical protein